MIAAKLLDDLNRAGATIEFVDGRPRIRGARIPENLRLALKASRVDVLAEFERRRQEDRDRYGRVPPPDAPMLATDTDLPESQRLQIIVHVIRQPRPLHAWVMVRSNEYHERGLSIEDCDWRACLDVIGWQRASSGLEAADFVSALAVVPRIEFAARPQNPTVARTARQ